MIGFDIIGEMIQRPTEIGEARVILPGWHVNTTPEVLASRPELAPFVVTPATYERVWASDDPTAPTMTVALLFADQAEADAVLNG